MFAKQVFSLTNLMKWLKDKKLLEEVEELKEKWLYETYSKYEPYLVTFQQCNRKGRLYYAHV